MKIAKEVEKILTVEELRKLNEPIVDTNDKHDSNHLNRLAEWTVNRIGTMGFFFACVILVSIPLVYSPVMPIIQYISSSYLSLTLLPLILLGQNLQAKNIEVRAQSDYKTNIRSKREIEVILLHLEKQDRVMIEMLTEIKSLAKRKEKEG